MATQLTIRIEARRQRLTRYMTWSAAELAEFGAELRAQRVIDEQQWQYQVTPDAEDQD